MTVEKLNTECPICHTKNLVLQLVELGTAITTCINEECGFRFQSNALNMRDKADQKEVADMDMVTYALHRMALDNGCFIGTLTLYKINSKMEVNIQNPHIISKTILNGGLDFSRSDIQRIIDHYESQRQQETESEEPE
jgi:Zn ribbon nucleic-acid-binding protein